MSSWPPKRRRAVAALVGAALLTAACSDVDPGDHGSGTGDSDINDSSTESAQDEQTNQNPIPEPQYDGDDTVRLPIAVVSPAGHNLIAPIGEDGSIGEPQARGADGQTIGAPPHQTEIARTEVFGCQDTISVVQTVPVVTDDPAAAALEYLLALGSVTHGEPAFSNPLSISEDLSITSVELSGNQVIVTLDGEPAARDACQTWQVAKQIETTARIATGADSAEIRMENSTLNELWGLSDDGPLQITEIQRG